MGIYTPTSRQVSKSKQKKFPDDKIEGKKDISDLAYDKSK